jgi:hypothetical protein
VYADLLCGVIGPQDGPDFPIKEPNAMNVSESGRRLGGVSGFLSFATVAAILVLGWRLRDEHYLTAENGLGYALGIAGGLLMLLLLAYPLRKRARLMHAWGPVRYWFRMHMTLGVAGPILILFHCDFSLGSLNSNVALLSMLVVAGSGLIGRHIYTRIHYGLYGARTSLERLAVDSERSQQRLAPVFAISPQVRNLLREFERTAMSPSRSMLASLSRILSLSLATRRVHRKADHALAIAVRESAARLGWSRSERKRRLRRMRDHIASHLALVRKVAGFSLYERLFSFWHVLHLPLFVMLLITAVVHVWAVHAY